MRTPSVAVVVVVGLPERAERVDGDFVIVAEVVPERLEVAAVEVAAEDHALAVGLAAVVDDVAGAVDDRLAVLVVDGVPLVAEVPVELAVGSEDEGVGRVVVLGRADLREQDFFLVGLAVAVFVGEDEDVRGHRDDHLVAEHADAEGAIDVAALVEDGLLVGMAVADRCLRGSGSDPPRAAAVAAAIVHDLADPDPAQVIDVDVRRAQEHRLAREQRRLQAVGDVEPGDRVFQRRARRPNSPALASRVGGFRSKMRNWTVLPPP